MIVQYNKMEFNQAAVRSVSGEGQRQPRVATRTCRSKCSAREHPVFNYPNKIGPSTWDGWVQERGLYFLGEKDAKYVDLVR